MADIPQLAVKIEPLGDRVVILPLEKEQVTASGLIIPETTSGEKPSEGVVIALGTGGIGKDAQNPKDFLKIGDKVLFGRYAGDEIKLKDKKGKEIEVKILHLDAILGKVA